MQHTACHLPVCSLVPCHLPAVLTCAPAAPLSPALPPLPFPHVQANAMGPFSAVYYVWQHAAVPGKKVPVPTWILVFGGAGIVTGLATYGWHIMGLYGEFWLCLVVCWSCGRRRGLYIFKPAALHMSRPGGKPAPAPRLTQTPPHISHPLLNIIQA